MQLLDNDSFYQWGGFLILFLINKTVYISLRVDIALFHYILDESLDNYRQSFPILLHIIMPPYVDPLAAEIKPIILIVKDRKYMIIPRELIN